VSSSVQNWTGVWLDSVLALSAAGRGPTALVTHGRVLPEFREQGIGFSLKQAQRHGHSITAIPS